MQSVCRSLLSGAMPGVGMLKCRTLECLQCLTERLISNVQKHNMQPTNDRERAQGRNRLPDEQVHDNAQMQQGHGQLQHAEEVQQHETPVAERAWLQQHVSQPPAVMPPPLRPQQQPATAPHLQIPQR